jgi:hypothetical protein
LSASGERRLRGDQVLVVEERAAERTHEEVVAERELTRDLPQAKLRAYRRNDP